MKPRFGLTTIVQIVLSLVVLVMVGKLVDTSSGNDKKGGHNDEPAQETTKPAPTPPPVPTPTPPAGKDGKPQIAKPVGASDGMVPVQPSRMQKEKMDDQRLKMLAEMKKHGGTKTGVPGVAPAPDGMDPALWQTRDMGQVAPKVEVKKQ